MPRKVLLRLLRRLDASCLRVSDSIRLQLEIEIIGLLQLADRPPVAAPASLGYSR